MAVATTATTWRSVPIVVAMPLPAPAPRRELHDRRIQMRGFARDDGLFDIEGHLTDRKPLDFQVTVGPLRRAGEPLHQMWVRLTIDGDLVVRDAVAATDHAPYRDCLGAPPSLAQLIGLRIGSGWIREIKERLGGVKSCTHLVEMLAPMGTTAIQALVKQLREIPLPLKVSGRPRQIDTCHAMAADRRVAALRWPEHYTGPRDAAGRPVGLDGAPYQPSEVLPDQVPGEA
jgi:hypothetical protein